MARAAGSHGIDRVFRGPHLYFGVVSRDKATVSTSVKWELGTFSIVVPGTLLRQNLCDSSLYEWKPGRRGSLRIFAELYAT